MKYVSEFRDQRIAAQLVEAIKAIADTDRHYAVMEFCGGHTHSLFRYGIQDLMPNNMEFIHGPGCPVCVLPIARIDMAIDLVQKQNVILCTYGDLMRVPASKRNSLQKTKAAGGDIRMVYSSQDALRIARENPQRQVMFFAIGFETTTPATAVALLQARAEQLQNFSVFCNHVLTPAALNALLENSNSDNIDGFLGPSHVSTIIGSQAYQPFAQQYKKPIVIAGFEPLDILQATLMVIRQINQDRHQVENEYIRAVSPEGNQKAQRLIRQTMEVREHFEWRGLGNIKQSALKINTEFQEFDAEARFKMKEQSALDIKSCDCPQILRGEKKPTDCALFGTVCTPENPMGSCMVSSEGACAAYWSYGRHRNPSHNQHTQLPQT